MPSVDSWAFINSYIFLSTKSQDEPRPLLISNMTILEPVLGFSPIWWLLLYASLILLLSPLVLVMVVFLPNLPILLLRRMCTIPVESIQSSKNNHQRRVPDPKIPESFSDPERIFLTNHVVMENNDGKLIGTLEDCHNRFFFLMSYYHQFRWASCTYLTKKNGCDFVQPLYAEFI